MPFEFTNPWGGVDDGWTFFAIELVVVLLAAGTFKAALRHDRPSLPARGSITPSVWGTAARTGVEPFHTAGAAAGNDGRTDKGLPATWFLARVCVFMFILELLMSQGTLNFSGREYFTCAEDTPACRRTLTTWGETRQAELSDDRD